MGAELGATTSTFPYTAAMRDYLVATGRGPVAHAADHAQRRGLLDRDEGAEWDDVVEVVSDFSESVSSYGRPKINSPSHMSKTGSFEFGTNYQRPVHSRPRNAHIEIRRLCKGTRLERRAQCWADWVLHK